MRRPRRMRMATPRCSASSKSAKDRISERTRWMRDLRRGLIAPPLFCLPRATRQLTRSFDHHLRPIPLNVVRAPCHPDVPRLGKIRRNLILHARRELAERRQLTERGLRAREHDRRHTLRRRTRVNLLARAHRIRKLPPHDRRHEHRSNAHRAIRPRRFAPSAARDAANAWHQPAPVPATSSG